MKIAIIGTGQMATALIKVLGKSHDVVIYGRNEAEAKSLAENYGEKAKKLSDNIEEEIVVPAVPYEAITQVLEEHKDSLKNKILVDISNAMDWEKFELLEGEGAQKIAKSLPEGAKLLKAFNTIPAVYLEKGEIEGKPLDVFIAGDDEYAKTKLSELINESGLRAIDIGPLSFAPYLESLLLINSRAGLKIGKGSQTSVKILP